MPLPKAIHRAFDIAIQNGATDESQFCGPYNMLLTYLFPFEEGYLVAPQFKRLTYSKFASFATIFTVEHKHHPVFFVEIKSSGSIRHISSRAEADLQMRNRFKRLFEDVEIDNLYGASAIGTKICLYKLDLVNRQLSPTFIPKNPEFVTDTAPIDRWNIDIMTPEGEEELCKVVQQIKEMSCQLCRYYLILCSRLLLIVLGFKLGRRPQSTEGVWHELAEGVRRRRDGGSG